MSNWTIITEDHLKATAHGALITQAREIDTGGIDPVTESIEDATARVRGAIATGNAMDINPAKIPNSLRGLAIRLAIFALAERIGLPLSEDQRESRRNDNSYLLRISDQKVRFETPDDASGSSEMQTGGGMETATSTPRQHYTREGLNGL